MIAACCWHCRQFVQMVRPDEEVDGSYHSNGFHMPLFPDYRFSGEYDYQLMIFSCVNCGYPNIAEISFPPDEALSGSSLEENITRWLPVEPIGKQYSEGVPPNVDE